jgi:hypothetical protein
VLNELEPSSNGLKRKGEMLLWNFLLVAALLRHFLPAPLSWHFLHAPYFCHFLLFFGLEILIIRKKANKAWMKI